MEGVNTAITTPRSLDFTGKPVSINKATTPSKSNVTSPPTFEWVQHGDASARRRARAHVTRTFRRQKAEQEQLGKTKNDNSRKGAPVKHHDTDTTTTTSIIQIGGEANAGTSAEEIAQGLVLFRTLGSGRTDPFSSLPVKLSPEKHVLLDHFIFGVAPLSYTFDERADFQPVKISGFNIALMDPAAFHVLLAVGASDITALHGEENASDCEDAIKHRSTAITMVNKRLSQGVADHSDKNLAAVVLLAGYELLFGTPQGFSTHMSGLAMMLKLRGSLAVLREENPQLYSWISWIDYAGSCNLFARRRFTTMNLNPLISNPEGVPEKMLQTAPEGYDLFQHITGAVTRFELVTAFMQSNQTEDTMRTMVSQHVSRMDAELYKSICVPDIVGNRSRRQYITQSFNIIQLMSASMALSSAGMNKDQFVEMMVTNLAGEATKFIVLLMDLAKLIFGGQKLSSDTLAIRVSLCVDAITELEWEAWRHIKTVLLDLFLHHEVCEGMLQTLWKQRIGRRSESPRSVGMGSVYKIKRPLH